MYKVIPTRVVFAFV